MIANSLYSLTAEEHWQLARVGGSLTIANRSANVVTVRLDKVEGSETITLAETGSGVSCDTDGLSKVTISASAYPSNILLLISPGFNLALTGLGAPAVWRPDPYAYQVLQGVAFTPKGGPAQDIEAQDG